MSERAQDYSLIKAFMMHKAFHLQGALETLILLHRVIFNSFYRGETEAGMPSDLFKTPRGVIFRAGIRIKEFFVPRSVFSTLDSSFHRELDLLNEHICFVSKDDVSPKKHFTALLVTVIAVRLTNFFRTKHHLCLALCSAFSVDTRQEGAF